MLGWAYWGKGKGYSTPLIAPPIPRCFRERAEVYAGKWKGPVWGVRVSQARLPCPRWSCFGAQKPKGLGETTPPLSTTAREMLRSCRKVCRAPSVLSGLRVAVRRS